MTARWERDNHSSIGRGVWYGNCCGAFNQPIPPGALPQGLRFLQLSQDFNQPLQVGSIPDTVEIIHAGVRHLNLGHNFNHPLSPGILPSSLRELVIGGRFDQPALEPGSLPDGLEVFVFDCNYRHPLQPGIIPSSVRVLSLSSYHHCKLVAGCIPASVKWLRLRSGYPAKVVHDAIVSPTTRVVLWREGDH